MLLARFDEWLLDEDERPDNGAAAFVASADMLPYDISAPFSIWSDEYDMWVLTKLNVSCARWFYPLPAMLPCATAPPHAPPRGELGCSGRSRTHPWVHTAYRRLASCPWGPPRATSPWGHIAV